MEFLGLTPWEWILPILIGVMAGFTTNAVAIWMLFHPYRPVRFAGINLLPMGAIPKEIDRIARRIGETIGRELLTPEDIAKTLSSESFRNRFDETLRSALTALVDREIGPLGDLFSPQQTAGIEQALDRLLDKFLEGLEAYLNSPEWEERVRSFASGLGSEFRERPLSVVLTPGLQLDLNRGITRLWSGVRESPEFSRVIAEAIDRAIGRMVVSEKPLRHYVPTGAVNLGESFVSNYLPILLEKIGGILDDPATRAKLQETLRRFTDRFLEAQKTWKRVVGRLMITERTLAQTVEAIEQGGVDEIAVLLKEPEVQARIAESVNKSVEEMLDKPLRELLASLTPERAEKLRSALVERVLYLFRHPTTEEVIVTRLTQVIGAIGERRVGDVVDLLGQERARDLTDQAADWVVETLRGERALGFIRGALEHRTAWMLSIPIGRLSDYLPPDAVDGAERVLFDPVWAFLQRRVPTAVAGLPVAQMVETKLKSYPVSKVEELIWRISERELFLIIYLGGFLGALVGSLMLVLESVPAGLLASGVFLILALIFINAKA